MLEGFNPNKEYFFNKDIAFANDKTLKINYENGNGKDWIDYCNGRKVNELHGEIGFIDDEIGIAFYSIDPRWCKEI